MKKFISMLILAVMLAMPSFACKSKDKDPMPVTNVHVNNSNTATIAGAAMGAVAIVAIVAIVKHSKKRKN